MKKSLTIMMCLLLLVGMSSISFAQTTTGKGIVDAAGDALGAVDLIGAAVEMYERKKPGGVDRLMKLTITVAAGDQLPGALIFEADVDDSTGTGGTMGQLGAPVPPCPCKTVAGLDIAITTYHRRQEDTAGSAFCASCVGDNLTDPDPGGSCGAKREAGEWYAMASLTGQPTRALGVLRGFNDPVPQNPADGATEQSYTFPYSTILAYAYNELTDAGFGIGDRFNFDKASSGAVANCKWQVAAYDDVAADGDDVTSNGATTFDVSDWAPNGNGVLADAELADGVTYCEGNFDNDGDVDGTDASVFKSNFGRGGYTDPCPTANQYW